VLQDIVPVQLSLTAGDLVTLWAPLWREEGEEWEAFLGDGEVLYAFPEVAQLAAFVRTADGHDLSDHPAWHVVPGLSVAELTPEEMHRYDVVGVPELAAADPDHLTTEFTKQKREGRLFLDVNRNAYAQTAVAPYAVRARRGAPVAVPITWKDVESDQLRPDGVGIRNITQWLKGRDDPWKSMERSQKPLPPLTESEIPDRSGRRKGVSRKGS